MPVAASGMASSAVVPRSTVPDLLAACERHALVRFRPRQGTIEEHTKHEQVRIDADDDKHAPCSIGTRALKTIGAEIGRNTRHRPDHAAGADPPHADRVAYRHGNRRATLAGRRTVTVRP